MHKMEDALWLLLENKPRIYTHPFRTSINSFETSNAKVIVGISFSVIAILVALLSLTSVSKRNSKKNNILHIAKE